VPPPFRWEGRIIAMGKINIGIVGAAGYVGGELIRILSTHPEAEIAALSRVRSEGNQDLADVQPQLRDALNNIPRRVAAFDAETLGEVCDVVFIAAPHGQAIAMAPPLLRKGARVIDMGADFRLKDPSVYEQWYKVQHTEHELLAEAAYGLPEIDREPIRSARLVANPGCYPTSASLALFPLVKAKLIDLSTIVIDSKSGVSGAGRSKLTLDFFFTEVINDFKAYSVASHRHTPEIEQVLAEIAGESITLSFTPHLLPIARGILTTTYSVLRPGVSEGQIQQRFGECYQGEPFVRLLPDGLLPQIKHVVGSNYCDIGWKVDSRTNRIITVSVLDNLVKGAAGAAVQNMNIIFRLPETMGLKHPPFVP